MANKMSTSTRPTNTPKQITVRTRLLRCFTHLSHELITLAVIAITLAGANTAVRAQDIVEIESNSDEWLKSVSDPTTFAFDEFYPGISGGKGLLSGRVVDLDLGGTVLTIEEVGRAGGAIKDASSYAAVSDASLYLVTTGVGSRWTFSEPIYGLYTYYGSADRNNTCSMLLYYQNNLVAQISRKGSGNDVHAVGHGFVSDQPIDRIDFSIDGPDNAVLIGAFVGIDPTDRPLATKVIPGYSGPNGSNVDADFGLSLTPPPAFYVDVTTLFAGSVAHVIVERALPDTATHLAYSLQGRGSTYIPQLGIDLDLQNPRKASGAIRSDTDGNASWQLYIPPAAQNATVWFQAAQVGGASNPVERFVN